jgi:hypothetical protein
VEITETFLDAIHDVEDPQTRQRIKRVDVTWPITIDTDISEDIVADDDDGRQYNEDTWNGQDDYFYFSLFNAPAWRFQTVAIPQGATIDSATLTVNNAQTATAASTLYGEDVDDAALWTNNDSQTGPMDMTKTSASVAFTGFGSAGEKQFDVKTIVQEIVDRESWSSGNDMRFGAIEATSGSGVVTFKSYDYNPSASGDLDVTYSEGVTKIPTVQTAVWATPIATKTLGTVTQTVVANTSAWAVPAAESSLAAQKAVGITDITIKFST